MFVFTDKRSMAGTCMLGSEKYDGGKHLWIKSDWRYRYMYGYERHIWPCKSLLVSCLHSPARWISLHSLVMNDSFAALRCFEHNLSQWCIQGDISINKVEFKYPRFSMKKDHAEEILISFCSNQTRMNRVTASMDRELYEVREDNTFHCLVRILTTFS